MNSTETKFIADFLVADFEREMQTTLSVLEAVPDGHLDYRPDPKSKTGLGLVRHIALEDDWLLNCIANGTFTPPPDDSDACGIMGPRDAVVRYKAKLPGALGRVRAMSGEALANTLNLFDMMQGPAVIFLAMALKHSVHHRGQLSTYLRAMGGKVPGIYGPTADTQSPQTASV
jgi:DinB family protein